jgi:putative hydrolase of HD superfamily
MMDEIKQTLNFIVEIEKLKNVLRKTRPVGLDRYENSAEHSWHVCLSALMLKDYANDKVDINRVIKMLLIHDLGEIDAGDTIIYAGETQAIKDEEKAGIKRLLDLLPEEKSDEYMALWLEFEAGESAESKYAKAIDRVPPLLHNLHGDGHSWKKHNISKEQVFSVNKRIEKGSVQLWEVLEDMLDEAVESKLLK